MPSAQMMANNAVQAAEGRLTQLQADAAELTRALRVEQTQLGQALASLKVSYLIDSDNKKKDFSSLQTSHSHRVPVSL